MAFFIKVYLTALCIFFVIDLFWLGVIAKNLYKEELGFLLAPSVRWGAALLFYGLYLFGLTFFAILPGVREQSGLVAALNGALFGCICYATYDLTNLATLQGWPMKIVIYDLLWGTFISSITSFLTFWISYRWII